MLKENAIIKDWRNIDLSFGLIYPNIYKIGMSSYSIRLLYFMINSYDNIVCERIFLPEKIYFPASKDYSSENQLRSIENKVLPIDFDILGFSIQFENDFKNILWILEKARIPLDRKNKEAYDLSNRILEIRDEAHGVDNFIRRLIEFNLDGEVWNSEIKGGMPNSVLGEIDNGSRE